MSHIPAHAMPHAKPHDDEHQPLNGAALEPAPTPAEPAAAKPETIAVADLPPREPSTPWVPILIGVLAVGGAVAAAIGLRARPPKKAKRPAKRREKTGKHPGRASHASRAARQAAG